jgi:glycine dehydrogenase
MPTTSAPTLAQLENASEFHARHIGIDAADEALMLKAIGETSRRALIDSIVPRSIARSSKMDIPAAISEAAAPPGTPPTRPTKPRFPRAAWKRW